MQKIEKKKTENQILDVLKFIASILIAGSHMLPLFSKEIYNLYYGQWLFRFCVPLFFVSSGYFFSKMDRDGGRKYIIRIALLYGFALILYAPKILGANMQYRGLQFIYEVVMSIYVGYSHLWYLSALLIGSVILYFIFRHPGLNSLLKRFDLVIIPILCICGAVFDEYWQILPSGIIYTLLDKVNMVGGARHALFFALPMLLIGRRLAETEESKIPVPMLLIMLLFSWVLSFLECRFMFSAIGMHITNDITFSNYLPAVFLFMLSFRIPLRLPGKMARQMRVMSEYIYILHPLVLERARSDMGLQGMPLLIYTTISCSLICWFLGKIARK